MQIISFIKSKESQLIGLLCSFIILAGILYSLHLGDKLRYPDEWLYYIMAGNLSSKGLYSLDGINPSACRPPGYSFFLSIFMSMGANLIVLRILNFVMLAGTLYLIYILLKRECSPVAGLIGAVLVILYPVLFYTAGTFYPQTIGALLFLSVIYLILSSDLTGKRSAAAGLLMGYLIITIPTFIFQFLLITIWMKAYKYKILYIIIFFIITCAIISIWQIRNYTAFKSLFFISANSGKMLLEGNSENAGPNSGITTDILSYEKNTAGMNEVEKDAYLRDRAFEYICKNKWKSLKLYAGKVLNYFNYRNELETKSESSPWKDVIMLFTYGGLLLSFTIRLFYFKYVKLNKFELFLIIIYISNAFFSAIFFTRIRYRLPFDFCLIALVALFFYNLSKSQNGSLFYKDYKNEHTYNI
mgnify:CR=1 FL=1